VVGTPVPALKQGVNEMSLPELLPSAVTVIGVIVLGALTAAGMAGGRAKPQPVPVPARREPPPRRR